MLLMLLPPLRHDDMLLFAAIRRRLIRYILLRCHAAFHCYAPVACHAAAACCRHADVTLLSIIHALLRRRYAFAMPCRLHAADDIIY